MAKLAINHETREMALWTSDGRAIFLDALDGIFDSELRAATGGDDRLGENAEMLSREIGADFLTPALAGLALAEARSVLKLPGSRKELRRRWDEMWRESINREVNRRVTPRTRRFRNRVGAPRERHEVSEPEIWALALREEALANGARTRKAASEEAMRHSKNTLEVRDVFWKKDSEGRDVPRAKDPDDKLNRIEERLMAECGGDRTKYADRLRSAGVRVKVSEADRLLAKTRS